MAVVLLLLLLLLFVTPVLARSAWMCMEGSGVLDRLVIDTLEVDRCCWSLSITITFFERARVCVECGWMWMNVDECGWM